MQKAQFEDIVTRIFTENGFVTAGQNTETGGEADLVMTRDGITFCVEVMPSKTLMYTSRGILAAAENLEKRATEKDWNPVIVAGGVLDPARREEIRENGFRGELIDVENLLNMAHSSRELYDELLACLSYSSGILSPREPNYDFNSERRRRSDQGVKYYYKIENRRKADRYGDANWEYFDSWEKRAHVYGSSAAELSWMEAREPQDNSDLIQEIQGWKGGRGVSPSAQYEKLCTRILKRLFADDLTLWNEQAKSNSDLYRFDLLCKIKRDNHRDFWEMAERYFDSKYIIFEFKNYAEKVTQKEVYTTVRYLYSTALRRVAIIISPNGIDAHADKAIRGVLRDEGKLILSLTNEELVRMLKMKENGEDPADYLSDKLDDLLIDLEK